EYVVGKLADQLRIAVQDVRPQHDAPTVPGRQLAQALDVTKVHAAFAYLCRQRRRLARGQVPGLVAVDVEPAGGERRQKVGVQLIQEPICLLARRGQAPAPADFVEEAVLRQG